MTPPTDNYKAMLARAPSAPGAGCSARSIATSSVRAWAPAFSRGCPSDDVHDVTTCRAATAADAHAHSAHSAHSRRTRTAGERRPRCEATAPQPLGAPLSIFEVGSDGNERHLGRCQPTRRNTVDSNESGLACHGRIRKRVLPAKQTRDDKAAR